VIQIFYKSNLTPSFSIIYLFIYFVQSNDRDGLGQVRNKLVWTGLKSLRKKNVQW